MEDENLTKDTLEYLKGEGPTNTFKLSSEMGLERSKLLNLLKKLEEKQAVRFEHGNVIFLKFPSEEKPKSTKVKKFLPAPKEKVERKPAEPKVLQLLQTENKQLKEKLLEIKKKRVSPPKTITKIIIKKIPASKRLKNKLLELEKTIELLEQKAATPKVITKTIIKKVPVIKNKGRLKIPKFKLPKIKRKFKLLEFKLLKNVKQLRKPEFAKY